MPIHVCYVLSTNGEPYYGDLLAVSAKAVRRLYPDARMTIVTDERSLDFARPLADRLAASVRSAGPYRGDVRARSRFAKTQVRDLIDGDFLYLDADTLPVARFDELFACEAPLAAARDRNRTNAAGTFPADRVDDFRRMGWPHPTPFYVNSGVVFWRDSPAARELGRLWPANWRKFFETLENPMDTAALNTSIANLGITPTIVDHRFNLWP